MRTPYAKNQFWYSKLKDFDRCPRYYKLKHIDGVPVPEEKSADLSFGTAIHAALNYHLETGESGVSVFERFWDLAAAEGLEYGRYKHAELHAIADILLQRFERLHSKHFKPHMMEERLYHRGLEGTPDFVGEYKGVKSVVDFKTSAQRYHPLRIRSDDQLPLYAWLAREAPGERCGYHAEQIVYVVLIKDLKAPSIQVLTAPMSEQLALKAASLAGDKCDDILASNFTPNSSSCIVGTRVCPYWEHCHGPKPKKGGDEE